MNKYYKYQDKIINSFLFVPKFLFSDKRFIKLNTTDKLIYSLYLERYSITQYQDKVGKYIIYTDEDIVDKLYINERTCMRTRKRLEECHLIQVQKTATYNKIYLLNCFSNSNQSHFFNEDDLESLKFYQFPRELFNDNYKNLSLNSKMVYTVFLDTLNLSQMNYFVDENERIYFQETVDIQIKKLNLTAPTVREARYLLMVCGLLLEYKTFSEDIRYYPLKLSHFTDRTQEYKKCKTAKEKKSYIEKVTHDDKEELILNPLRIGVRLKSLRKEIGLSQVLLVSLLKKQNIILTQQAYSSYERGKTHIPKDIYDACIKIIQNEKKKTTGDTILKEKIVMSYNTEEKNSHEIQSQSKDLSFDEENNVISQKQELSHAKRKKSHTNYTETNLTENNKTEEFILLINKINNIINTSYILRDNKDYLIACFDKLRIYKKFYLNTSQEMYKTEDLITVFKELNNKEEIEQIFMSVLDKIEMNHYTFKTPDSQINCFITFLLNELKYRKKEENHPSWFKPKNYNRVTSSFIDVDDEIKNYNWWDE